MTPLLAGPRPIDLTRTAIPPGLRVAVLAPHPDDFDAISVTMRHLHTHDASIELAVLTTGISGVEDGFKGAVTDEDKAAIREAEQRLSCALFGLTQERCRFFRLAGGSDDAHVIHEFLVGVRPQLIFIPHGNDSNATHRRAHALVTGALVDARLSATLCLAEDPKTLGIRRDVFMPFGEADAQWKSRLLRLHASQHQRNLATRGRGFDERILDANRRTARELGRQEDFAEAFELAEFVDGALAVAPA